MKFSVLVVVCLACSALGSPVQTAVIPAIARDFDIMTNTKQLVQELISNLRSAADQAMDSVKVFKQGLEHQAVLFEEKVVQDVQNMKEGIENTIKSIADKLSGASTAVSNCVNSHKKSAEDLMTTTLENIRACSTGCVEDVGELIEELLATATNASTYASDAVSDVQSCAENNELNYFSKAKCLATIAVQAEARGAKYIAQCGLLVGRINLAFATLPAKLEVCAGTNFVEAGVTSAKMLMEIGTCSASSLYESMTNPEGYSVIIKNQS